MKTSTCYPSSFYNRLVPLWPKGGRGEMVKWSLLLTIIVAGSFCSHCVLSKLTHVSVLGRMTSRQRLLVSVLGVAVSVLGIERVMSYCVRSAATELLPSVECDLSALPGRLRLDVPITTDGRGTIALRNFQPFRTYIFQFETDAIVSLSEPYDASVMRLSGPGGLLIENEEQLASHDVVHVTLTRRKRSPAERSIALNMAARVVETDAYPNFGNQRWRHWIDSTPDRTEPGTATAALVSHVGDRWNGLEVLALGVESGSEPLFLTGHGANVTAVDGTPHAIAISCLRHAECGRLDKITAALPCLLEELPSELGNFDAVTGGPIFPFLPPYCFQDVIEGKILPRVSESGYFSGVFFGPEHAWSHRDDMTFTSLEEVRDLLEKNGFEIVQLKESRQRKAVLKRSILWHEVAVVARKRCHNNRLACRIGTGRDAGRDSSVHL